MLADLSPYEAMTLLCIVGTFLLMLLGIAKKDIAAGCVLGIFVIWGRWYLSAHIPHEAQKEAAAHLEMQVD